MGFYYGESELVVRFKLLITLLITIIPVLSFAKDLLNDVEKWINQQKVRAVDIDKNKAQLPIRTGKGVNLDNLLNRYNKSKMYQNNIKQKPNYPNLITFVSLSMPHDTLVKLVQDNHKADGKVIIRGMLNGNDLLGTISRVKHIIKQAGVGSIDIDPLPFRTFSIKQVPSFVISKKSYSNCQDTECSNKPPYDKITGNISLNYALQTIIKHGEVNNIAQQHLNRLENNE